MSNHGDNIDVVTKNCDFSSSSSTVYTTTSATTSCTLTTTQSVGTRLSLGDQLYNDFIQSTDYQAYRSSSVNIQNNPFDTQQPNLNTVPAISSLTVSQFDHPHNIRNQNNTQVTSTFDKHFFLKMLPEFDGSSEKIAKFISICDFYSQQINQNNQLEFLNIILSRLVGRAYNTMRFCATETYNELRVELLQHFRPYKPLPQLYRDLTNIKQSFGESMQSYVDRMQDLLNSLNEESIEEIKKEDPIPSQTSVDTMLRRNENLAKDAFIYGCKQPLSSILVSCRFNTLNDTITFALQQSRLIQSKYCTYCKMSNHNTDDCTRRTNQPSRFSNSSSSQSSSVQPSTSAVTSSSASSHSVSNSSSTGNSFCNYCKKRGHVISNCEKRRLRNQDLNSNQSTNSRPVDPK